MAGQALATLGLTMSAQPSGEDCGDDARCTHQGRIAELEDQARLDRAMIAYLKNQMTNAELAGEQLEVALKSSRRIGAAVGILMSALKVTEDAAFTSLCKISQKQNRKLRTIADDIVFDRTPFGGPSVMRVLVG